jgi:hypothetical protein
VQLPCAQACESIVLQRFLRVIILVSTTMDLKGGTVVMCGRSCHSQEMFTSTCGDVDIFSERKSVSRVTEAREIPMNE